MLAATVYHWWAVETDDGDDSVTPAAAANSQSGASRSVPQVTHIARKIDANEIEMQKTADDDVKDSTSQSDSTSRDGSETGQSSASGSSQSDVSTCMCYVL